MGGRFDGKVILVTGGARGIGAATARRAVEEGVRALSSRTSEPETSQERVRYVRCDVADRGSVEGLFASIEATEGGLDILVNNASIQRVALTELVDPDSWEFVVRTHLRGTFHCGSLAIPSMRAGGRVGGTTGPGPVLGCHDGHDEPVSVYGGRGGRNSASGCNAVAPGLTQTALVEQSPIPRTDQPPSTTIVCPMM